MSRVIDATAGDETVLKDVNHYHQCEIQFQLSIYMVIGLVENQQWLKEIILKTHTLSIIRSSTDLIIISLKINLFLA